MKNLQRLLATLLSLVLIWLPLLQAEASAVVPEVTPVQLQMEEREGYLTKEEAGAMLRQYLVERRTDEMAIKLCLEDEDHLLPEQVLDILLVEAIRHTGKGYEGDTLRWCYNSVSYGMEEDFDGENHYITFTMQGAEYYARPEQDAILNTKVEQIMAELNLDGKSDYEKVFAIYDYVCKNVKYAEAILEDGIDGTNPPPEYYHYYSTYGALVEGEATCQGFCNAMYRLLLEAGIDNRIISGDSHGWNIVKLGDRYYCLDATWDSDTYHLGDGNYKWFLKGASAFWNIGHTTDPYCATQEFLSQYPVSALDYGAEATATAAGTWGGNVTWSLTEDGTLTISGSGEMENMSAQTQPWLNYRGYIKKVVIESGITSIGSEAFYACQELTSVEIPDTVQGIGGNAFSLCTKLQQIRIPDSVTALGAGALLNCWSLNDVTLSENLTEISFGLFKNCLRLETVVIPGGVKTIDDQAFASCVSLAQLTIPDSVTRIGNAVFASAFNPEAKAVIVIPESVTEIGYQLFAWSGVCEVVWNAQTTKLDIWSFYLNYNLEKVTLSDTITEFGESVFQNCTSLREVNIPAALRQVEACTFLNCMSLRSVQLPDTLDSLSASMFSGCKSLTQIDLPDQITVIPANAFSDTGLTSVDLDGITEIGYGAFSGAALREVWIPAGVVKMETFAFSKCDVLQKVVFLGSVPENFGNGEPSSVFATFVQRDLTVYYPDGNETWTEDVVTNLQGSLGLRACAYRMIDGHRVVLRWESDDENHWYGCMDCDYRDSVSAHNYDSNCDTDCNDCGYIREITHVYVQNFNEGFHWMECACGDIVDEQMHVFDNWCDDSCSECGYIREPFHNYYILKWDETHHWYECDCGAKDRIEEHYGSGEFCDGCSYWYNHTHELLNLYFDENGHWFGCGCGYETEPEEHVWEGGYCVVCWIPKPAGDAVAGDVNGDGAVDTTDAKLIMQFDLGLIGESNLVLQVADVNGDGAVDTTDAKLIMQFDLGIIQDFS